ncbi:hypothetical protein ISP15_07015 [Dyella jejuensis]|uniref:DUF6933 domain-containing protein n=2 Tax=Dyella jejuensis TaxID=1432009 RepID=A0ABW8JIK9_9GAMM
MKATPETRPHPSHNRLGEWTANLVRVSRIQLVIAVSEPTRFAVVIDAAPYAAVRERFQHALFHALLHIGIPADAAASEVEATYPLEPAVSNCRSVLGTLNRFADEVASALYHGQACSAAELTRQLSGTIVLKPAHIVFPADRVREAFGLAPIDRRKMFPMLLPGDSRLH